MVFSVGSLNYLANIRTKGGVQKIMLEQIMNSPTMDYLGRGLQAATMRHEVISNNIANVNTPNFKKSEVVFESLLAKELGLDSKGKLAMVRTNDKHLPMAPEGGATAQIHQVTTTSMRTDNNNVDIDVKWPAWRRTSCIIMLWLETSAATSRR